MYQCALAQETCGGISVMFSLVYLKISGYMGGGSQSSFLRAMGVLHSFLTV